MKTEQKNCPICGDILVEVEAALNRTWSNFLLTGFGSSQLQIRQLNHQWLPFMNPGKIACSLYYSECGALTIAPTITSHRKELGIDE